MEPHPAYFETHFRVAQRDIVWPAVFCIITAYATTGSVWTPEQNRLADERLEAELTQRGVWKIRITGFSPTTGHAEPGWAVVLSLADSCAIGNRYHQDAIYSVEGDELFVSGCATDKSFHERVGTFRERLVYDTI